MLGQGRIPGLCTVSFVLRKPKFEREAEIEFLNHAGGT